MGCLFGMPWSFVFFLGFLSGIVLMIFMVVMNGGVWPEGGE